MKHYSTSRPAGVDNYTPGFCISLDLPWFAPCLEFPNGDPRVPHDLRSIVAADSLVLTFVLRDSFHCSIGRHQSQNRLVACFTSVIDDGLAFLITNVEISSGI